MVLEYTPGLMGIISEQMERLEPAMLQFGEALGGSPDSVKGLPFSEEADKDGMPEELYVRHDQAMIHNLTVALLNGHHVGLISPYGTGKTALREIVRRDLGEHPEFAIGYLDNAHETTPRGLYATVIRAALDTGYDLDADEYTQLREGVPWITDEAKEAVRDLAERVEADDQTLTLVVDEIEDFPTELLPMLQTVADAGVRLFLMGTPAGQDRLEEARDTLDSRIRYHEGIEPFDPEDVAEYAARSLAYFRGEEFNGQGPAPFTDDAIEAIHERTDGNPRDVRLECADTLAKAAIAWHQSDRDVENFQIDRRLVTSTVTS
jgi:type II secretory pathway predicted ATPase ExeA